MNRSKFFRYTHLSLISVEETFIAFSCILETRQLVRSCYESSMVA